MSEEQEITTGTALPAPAEGASAEISEEVKAKIREKMAQFQKSKGKTISGSEAVDDIPEGSGSVNSGKDVDWTEYDLPSGLRHLYPRATYRETEQGPAWVAMAEEFLAIERSWGSYDTPVDDPQQLKGNKADFLNLGESLNNRLNSPEGWAVVSILPATSGRVGVLLRRAVPVRLPEPMLLKKEVEVEPPTDIELERTEDAALKFAEEIGMAAPELEGYVEGADWQDPNAAV